MRWWLPALAAAHAAGIVAADLGAPRDLAAWAGLHALLAGLLVGRSTPRLLLACVAAAAAGVIALPPRPPPLADGAGVVEGRLAQTTAGPAFVELRGIAGDAPSGALALGRESAEVLAAHAPGARTRAALRWRPVRGRSNPGGRDPARRLARSGLAGRARLRDPLLQSVVDGPAGWSARWHAGLRRAAARLVRRGDGGALLAALALARRGALAPELRQRLARGGLAHLLAVSGLHLLLVAGGAALLARLALRRLAWLAARLDTRRVALGVGAVTGGAYAAVTGAPISLQRALVFGAAASLAPALRRSTSLRAALAAAGLAVLGLEPAALFAPSAQLSFAAAAAVMVAARRAPGAPRVLEGAARSAAAASAATAPIAAWVFGRASPLGWLANLLAVPWTAVVLLPLALAAAAVAALAPAGPPWDPALDAAARLAALSLRVASAWGAAVPCFEPIAPGPAAGLLAWACLALALAWRRTSGLVLAAIAGPLLLAYVPPDPLTPPPPRAIFLDVGQGDAALVQGPRASVLVDGGGAWPGGDAGHSVVLPALAAAGVRRLALVVASHADLDHRGGLRAVLEALPVDELWIPSGGAADPGFAGLLALARRRGVPVRERAAGGPPRSFGMLRVEVLGPPPGGAATRNDGSLVLRIAAGGWHLLLPGDLEHGGEATLLREGAELDAEVLKLGHHGSRTSSSAVFLAAVHPLVAIGSAPRSGRFGMPHPEVRRRLAAAGAALCWTGREGAVIVGLGTRLVVRTPWAAAGASLACAAAGARGRGHEPVRACTGGPPCAW